MKKRIAALLAAAMLAAAAPTLAETMRIGDQAVVKKCKEYITLREADNVQATELARIPLGEQVIYLNPAKNGFALVEYGDTQGFVKAEYLANQTARATPFAITEEERHNVNLFLTNFTETGMERYDAVSTTDAELVRFGVLHAWLNRSGQWDATERGSRLEQDNVTDDVLRYFGRPLILLDQPDFDYDGAYYYMHEPGAPIGLGFVCASEVEMLGGGLYRVYFGVYGAGEIIDDDDVYDLLPEQAALLYPNTPFQGCAVIRALGLNSREGFRLERLRIE